MGRGCGRGGGVGVDFHFQRCVGFVENTQLRCVNSFMNCFFFFLWSTISLQQPAILGYSRAFIKKIMG